ncbi:MAG: hypothetical protein AB1567_11795, partial [bacterium]
NNGILMDTITPSFHHSIIPSFYHLPIFLIPFLTLLIYSLNGYKVTSIAIIHNLIKKVKLF